MTLLSKSQSVIRTLITLLAHYGFTMSPNHMLATLLPLTDLPTLKITLPLDKDLIMNTSADTYTPSLYGDQDHAQFGFISCHLTESRIAAATARARAANEATGDVVDVPFIKYAKSWPDRFGSVNKKNPGPAYAQPRWWAAYVATCIIFGLEVGSRWVPCYLCGDIYDAWTLDVEHIVDRDKAGTFAGNILLAHHGCNASKHKRSISPRLREYVSDIVGSHEWPRFCDGVKDMYNEYPRRAVGHMPSTKYDG